MPNPAYCVLWAPTFADLPTVGVVTGQPACTADDNADWTWDGAAWVPRPAVQAYATGAFTIPTGKYAMMSTRLRLTGAQRVALQGTARLRIT